VGLIARQLETSGVPTVSMSSAWSVTASVNPPRAVFLDFPLGHTAGPPDKSEEQLAIMGDTLRAFESASESGSIVPLDCHWPMDWKIAERNARNKGPRRTALPQYQFEDDQQCAVERHGGELALEPCDFARIPRD